MDKNRVHKQISHEEYLEWLTTYRSLLDDFTAYMEKEPDPTMVSFLRVAEHIFNFFINQMTTYEYVLYPESGEKKADAADDPTRTIIHTLKLERDKIADRIARMLESDTRMQKRFDEFCANLKDPRILGCQL